MFYVYVHCKPDGNPFYVGKGSGKRALTLWNNRNRHYKFVVQKYGKLNLVVYQIPCESEQRAFDLEIELIKNFRILGCKLTNFTDGGEGATGAVRSEETKRLQSLKALGNKRTLGLKRGPMPQSQRDKLSATRIARKIPAWNKGVPRPDEVKAKIVATKKARAGKQL